MRPRTAIALSALCGVLLACSALQLPGEPAAGPDIAITLEPLNGADGGFEVNEFPTDGQTASAPDDNGFELVAVPTGQAGQVRTVIDGDTITVEVDGQTYTVRYIGVDTPEREEPYYAEAQAANADLVAEQTVILVRDVSDVDEYGRWLRYVYLEDGLFVNAALIRQGYGRVVAFPPDVAELDYFRQLEQEASAAGLGLWGVAAQRGAPPGCATCAKNAYNCGDFPTQAAAQACYNYCLQETGSDVHRLSAGDSRVCKSRP